MYVTVKYNNGSQHLLAKFDTLDDAIRSAKTLHHPDWPVWQGIVVYDDQTGRSVFDSQRPDTRGNQ